MSDEFYSDGIGTITVIGGTVRLDFVSYSPNEQDSSGKPATVFRQRVVMSMEGFLKSAGMLNEAAQKITQRAGAPIQEDASAPGPASAERPSAPTPAASATVSPLPIKHPFP